MKKSSLILRGVAAAVVALSIGVLSGCGSSNAAPMQAAPVTAPAPAVTAVLVHGAWADGSSWAKVIPLLQQRGIKVVAVQLARNSLADDAATVRRALAAETGPVVLVGHSYGGAVITEAGTSANVAALVYVAAFAPGDGESVTDLISPYPQGAWQAGIVADKEGYLSLTTAVVQKYFAPDLPAAESATLAALQGPVHNRVLTDKVTTAAWKNKPVFWALSTEDQLLPAAFQQAEAARVKAKVTNINGSHVEMLSHPAEVTAVILDAIASVK